jgi:hypothetical protein
MYPKFNEKKKRRCVKIHFLLGLALSNKFLPVHCVVARDECPQRVLQDGFVIVPAHTKFYEIVSVVLRTMEGDVGKIEQDERADGKKGINFSRVFLI